MLRVISKLHHVVMPVVATHQVALRSAPHPFYVLHSTSRHDLCGDDALPVQLPAWASLNSLINLLADCADACDRHHTRNVHFSRLSNSSLFPATRPASAFRTAHAIARAITQSSCV